MYSRTALNKFRCLSEFKKPTFKIEKWISMQYFSLFFLLFFSFCAAYIPFFQRILKELSRLFEPMHSRMYNVVLICFFTVAVNMVCGDQMTGGHV